MIDLTDLLILFGSEHQFYGITTIKNILIGKKTVSNLYAAVRYQLLPLFGSFNHYQLVANNEAITELIEQGLMVVDERKRYRLTTAGNDLKQSWLQQMLPLGSLQIAAKYNLAGVIGRFRLLVQVVSEYSYQNHRYYPNYETYADKVLVKQWFQQNKQPDLPAQFKAQLMAFLKTIENDPAVIFANGLVGHQFYGKTTGQLATQLKRTPSMITIMELQVYGLLLTKLIQTNSPLLSLFTDLKRSLVANSALKSLALFQNGNSIKQIAQIQGVKENTVREHLLEAAICLPTEQFPFAMVLTPYVKTKVANLVAEMQMPLGEISYYQVVDQIDFFEFRLAQIYWSKENHDS